MRKIKEKLDRNWE